VDVVLVVVRPPEPRMAAPDFSETTSHLQDSWSG
jgi:hypothetical protein